METCILCGGNRTEVIIVKGADYEYGINFNSDVKRCIQCGLVWQYPIPKVEELKEYYPADYAEYSVPDQSDHPISFINNRKTSCKKNSISDRKKRKDSGRGMC